MKSKRIRQQLVASVLPLHENPNEDKHVESLFIPCLDEGSTPSSSTKYTILSDYYVDDDEENLNQCETLLKNAGAE